jgi:hypothetical protein
LINAETNLVIPGYETMADGIELDLTLLPTDQLNMKATLDPVQAERVEIYLNGVYHHTENVHPYTFPSNDGGDYHGYVFAPGAYTLTFQPYAVDGAAGTPLDFNFTVIRSPIIHSVIPLLECISPDPFNAGWFIAFFGYRNDNDSTISIPWGANNRFTPAPAVRLQPVDFSSGSHATAVITIFPNTGSLSWELDGNVAMANSSSPLCSTP